MHIITYNRLCHGLRMWFSASVRPETASGASNGKKSLPKHKSVQIRKERRPKINEINDA